MDQGAFHFNKLWLELTTPASEIPVIPLQARLNFV
jgi:hypothetical protein